VTESSDGDRRLVDVVKAAMAAWADHDIEGVLSHVADDIEWHYHVGSPPVQGREAMAKLLNRLKSHQLDSQWRLVRHAEADGTVFIEAIDDFRNPDGHRVQVPYSGVYQFDDGLITHWRDYLDMPTMMKSEGGEPPPEWLQALIDART
jgi:limonene-1,2-epoxide hydrolase